MAEFNGNVITNDGRNLLSRALAGQGKIIFTKAAFGAGRQDIPAREVRDLKDKKLDLVIMNRRNDSGTAILTVHITNKDVEESFHTQEFGVYAKLEGDKEEVLYCYSLAIEPDFFPNNKLGITYESVVDLYMTLSTEVESGIYIKEGTVFITKDIADQVYSTTGVAAVGKLEGRERLEADKSYLAADGSWYFNIGGAREWNKSGVKDTKLIPMTWKYLYEWIINKFSTLKLNWKDITDKPNLTSTEDLNKLLNKKEDTINKKTAFNKDFGIAAGTVLEGDKYPLIEQKFKGIAGNEINPGFIQNSGEKIQGKFYLDKNTGRLYRCVKNTNSITNSTENFQDVSLDAISDKLDNLFKKLNYESVILNINSIGEKIIETSSLSIIFWVELTNKYDWGEAAVLPILSYDMASWHVSPYPHMKAKFRFTSSSIEVAEIGSNVQIYRIITTRL